MKKHIKTNFKGSSQDEMAGKTCCCVCSIKYNLPGVVEASEKVKQTSHTPEAKYEAGNLSNAINIF